MIHTIESEETSEAVPGAGCHVAVIGGGFTGLAAAWELLKAGHRVTVFESDEQVGGLAGGFPVGNAILEKFYHHWFTNDVAITELVEELGLSDQLVARQSKTGMYYAKSMFRLSKPIDVLRFSPLPLIDRLRLALLVFQARSVRDWRRLESLTAREWLLSLCGKTVYRVVWEPLLRGKFGDVADEISAVWLWNKLCLRGGSRDKSGNEVLLYYKGGFAALSASFAKAIQARGGKILTGSPVQGVTVANGRIAGVVAGDSETPCDAAIVTTPLPTAADLLKPHISANEYAKLNRIRYLANVCLVLQLDRSLSDLYWINVNDPSFPFVGIIEHTNFEPPENYGGKHIVYLSRYLPATDSVYSLNSDDYLEYALPHIRRMFPAFQREWILDHRIWHADYAQPIVERNYSSLIPSYNAPVEDVYVCSMAQIYPEDRGTNYAIRSGREIGRRVSSDVHGRNPQVRAAV